LRGVVTLSLAGRLPTVAELSAVENDGLKAIVPMVDAVMNEEAFYHRLAEAFEDIFLTRGYDDVAENVLSYEHFEKTRHWYQKYDLQIADKSAEQKARYKANGRLSRGDAPGADGADQIHRAQRSAVHRDRNRRLHHGVALHGARATGCIDELIEKVRESLTIHLSTVPVRLNALKDRSKKVQESPTGYYPHAGILTTFHYLRRYPTTETNRNRLRSRMYYQHFLGIDVLELAPRVSDAAAITAKFEIPTMQASECVVCHKTLDPVAGLFQDYYQLPEALFGPRKEGWFKDMFGPGLEGEDLPQDQRWRALQWLGERTAKDPRFARTMVEHVYYILTGRKVLLAPTAIDDPLYDAKRRAYQAQRSEVERIAAKFVANGFNLKTAFQEWIASPFYRAESRAPVSSPESKAERQAEMADLGIARMLSPGATREEDRGCLWQAMEAAER
jgi:hypothetical protein